MDLLSNARNSIRIGVEDYSSSDQDRLVSCARNLFAGILLLFKHKLSLLSPNDSNEALIKERVRPQFNSSGVVKWVGCGKKTVAVKQIRERFESLGIPIKWERVKRINEFRNEVEHYYTKLSKDAMRELISDSFIVIRDFLSSSLNADPKEFLGEKNWNTLISVAEVYEKEKEECVQVIEAIDWGSASLCSALVSFKCTECGSGIISINDPKPDRFENIFYCRSCDNSWDFFDVAEEAMGDYFSFENYLSQTDGNDLATIQCPECSRRTYVVKDQRCLLCGAIYDHNCARCRGKIPPEEIDGSGFCSYCSYMMSKDD
ncbi:MAG: hypothetical protein V1753_04285 [Pseudomonadota bacterium]